MYDRLVTRWLSRNDGHLGTPTLQVRNLQSSVTGGCVCFFVFLEGVGEGGGGGGLGFRAWLWNNVVNSMAGSSFWILQEVWTVQ